MHPALLALALAQTSSTGAAQGAAAPCPTAPVAVPPELAGWASPVPVEAATSPDRSAAATLSIGRSVRAALPPVSTLSLAGPGGHAAPAGSQGGLLAFAVAASGRYRIALDGAAWIDVVKDGRVVDSLAHAHGLGCTGVRKMVDFALQPGRYLLQVTGSAAPTLQLLVVRVPG